MTTAVSAGLTLTTGITSTTSPWRNTIHVMPDSYRVVLYSNGTNLVVKSSPNGLTAFSAETIIKTGITALTPLIDCCVVGNALFVVIVSQATAGGVTTYTTTGYLLPYTGLGVWGTLISSTIATSTTAPPLSVRAVYDATQPILTAGHTSGTTGVIHVLTDTGSAWIMAALDPHNTTTPFTFLATATIPSGLTGPTGATNMLLRAMSALYLVSPGSAGWAASEVLFSSSTVMGGSPTTQTFNLLAAPLSATTIAAGSQHTWDGSTLYPVGVPVGTVNNGHGYAVSADVTSAIPTSAEAFPAGIWHLAMTGTLAVGTMSSYIQAHVYGKHLDGTTTLWFVMPNLQVGIAAGTWTLDAQQSVPAFTLNLGDQLYVELYFFTGSGGTLAVSAVTLTGPGFTPTTQNSYTAGALETPGPALSAAGAALCRSDTSAASGVDLFVYHSATGAIQTIRRNNSGSYTAPLDIGTLGGIALSSQGVAAAAHAVTGDEHVFALGSVSGVTHLYVLKKSASLWGAWARLDTSATSPVGSFGGPEPSSLSGMGDAIIYLDGTSPYILEWEDGGFAAASTAPDQPLIILVNSPGVVDLFGSIDPFNTLSATPSFLGTYRDSIANDRLGSYRLRVGSYDSGQVGVAGGPLPGGSFTIAYPGSAPALPHNTLTTATLTTWDSGGGNQSVSDGVTHFMVVDAPIVTLITASITAFSQSIAFDYWQTGSQPLAQYDLALVSGGVTAISLLGQIPAVLPRCTSLASLASAGALSLSTVDQLTPGQTISLGNTIGAEAATVTTVTGTGPYTIGLASPLVSTHPTTDRVNARIVTPPISWFPGVNNLSAYTLDLTTYVTPAVGTAWSLLTSVPVPVALPTSPPVDTLLSTWMQGTTPLTGGYCALSWDQPSPSLDGLEPLSWNVYQKPSSESVWNLVGSVPALIGPGTCSVWSIPSDTPLDFGVASVSSQGVESTLTTCSQAAVTFRLGLWLNEAGAPASCLEVGFRSTSQQMMVLEHLKNQDAATLFNRTAPVYTIDSLFALHTQTNGDYSLETGFETDCFALLDRWESEKTPVLIRDWRGRMFIGAVVNVTETIPDITLYRGISLELGETDPFGYRYLLTFP